ncbi:MAG: Sapep family Mn(2+)-dependent dipeptidase [Clostridia bacterium]
MNLDKMDALIASYQDEMLHMLKGWIAINSVQAEPTAQNAPFGDAVRQMLDLFLKDAAHLGFCVDDVDGFAGAAEMGKGEKTLGILAHLDIVPAGDGWKHEPFNATIEDGVFYGRGVQDDKGPALSALFAMRAVREAGIPLKDAVRLIVGCDEETGMTDMRHYHEVRKLPDYGFSPDAEYPLINIEKGGLGLMLSKASAGENDARIPVYSLFAGLRSNIVPGAATAEVGTAQVPFAELAAQVARICAAHDRFDVCASDLGNGRAKLTATGKQSHAALPEAGLNAAGMLLIVLAELDAGGGSNEAIRGLAQLLGIAYDGSGLGIAQKDDLSGALTCNLGLLRYDGALLTARLDIRYPICADESTLCGCAVMAASAWHIAVERMGGHTPLHVPADHPVVTGLLEVYHEQTGLPAYAIAIGGGTYSRTMPNTVAFGTSFPDDVECCHMPDEHVTLEKFMLSTRIMAHAIVRLAGQ